MIAIESQNARQTEREIRSRSRDIDLVILAGGDGTANSSAAVLYRCNLPFALFPQGTANDLARSLDLPDDIQDICNIIIEGYRRTVDLGVVNGRYFFNAAHIGLGVSISHQLTPQAKKKLGVLAYLRASIRALLRTRSFAVQIIVDDLQFNLRSIQVAVGNGRYYGGGNIIDDDAAIDSGRLCLYSLRPQTVWELITLAPLLRRGKQHQAKRTFSISGTKISIETRIPMEIYADGEFVTRTPAEFMVIPGALEAIAPRPSARIEGDPA